MTLDTQWPDGRPKVWTTDPARAEVYDYGGAPVATHNLLCERCGRQPAVYDLGAGVFEPCGTCFAVSTFPVLLSWLTKQRRGR